MMLKFTAGLLLSLLLFTPEARAALLIQDGQKVVFMGDSITDQGWNVPGGYVRLVVAGLKTLGVNIVPLPAGVSGQTSREMLARVTSDIINKKPDWLTLSCGVNDVWHGGGGVALDQYKKNITSIVDQAQAAGIKVVIMTSTVIGEDLGNANNVTLVAYNDFLKQLARERNLPLADENAAFQDAIKAAAPAPGVKVLTMDGVHPLPPGHQIMARTLLGAFGATPDQLNQVAQAWLDMPASAAVGSTLAFRVDDPITLRQYQAVKAAADKQKLSINDFCSGLFFQAILDTAKAHASDPAPPNEGQFESEAQKAFLARIQALPTS